MVKEAVVRDHQETAGLHSGAKEQENRVSCTTCIYMAAYCVAISALNTP